MIEEWKDIKGYEGHYQISNKGGVKSLRREVPHAKYGSRVVDSQELSPSFTTKKYLQVRFCVDKVKTTEKLHRLVAQAFIPNLENKPCVNHKDGVKTNNLVGNLEWCTWSENTQHATELGLMPDNRGSRSYRSILTEEDIPIIRERLSNGDTSSSIGQDYGVSSAAIFDIKRKKSWKHI